MYVTIWHSDFAGRWTEECALAQVLRLTPQEDGMTLSYLDLAEFPPHTVSGLAGYFDSDDREWKWLRCALPVGMRPNELPKDERPLSAKNIMTKKPVKKKAAKKKAAKKKARRR